MVCFVQDDHTCLSWVFFMKEKSKIGQLFKNFHIMVQTQFNAKTQILHTDNVKDYFKSILRAYLVQEGIVHQSSCPDIPQQNGIAKRKNKHLLDITQALMIFSRVPQIFLGDAVLIATYLINRMPSRVLTFQTPCQVFLKAYHTNCLISSIPLKVFGCTSFVHIPYQN